MKLKTSILIIDFAQSVLLLSSFLVIVVGVIGFKDGLRVVLIIVGIISFVIAFYIKRLILNYLLKKIKYPVEFLTVLKKMDLMSELNISWNFETLKQDRSSDLYTKLFLADNNFTVNLIKRKESKWIQYLFVFLSGVSFLLLLFFYKIKVPNQTYFFIIIALLVALFFPKKTKTHSIDQLNFTNDGFYWANNFIKWNIIDDWSYKSKNETEEIIIIKYKDAQNEEQTEKIVLKKNKTDIINFLILFSHYHTKNKDLSFD